MRRIMKLAGTMGVVLLLGVTAPVANAYWGWGGSPRGPGYGTGWGGQPYGGWRGYRVRPWAEPYEYDFYYQNAPASVRSDIRRAYRYGPDRWRWGRRSWGRWW
jgi:hypothetical protein